MVRNSFLLPNVEREEISGLVTKKQERHIVATVGTIIFLVLLFLLLWFVRLYAVVPEQEEGVEVAFGEVEEAGGYMAEENEAVPLEQPSAASPQPSAPSDNDLMTQEDEEALALRKEQEKKERERKQAEAERKAKEEAERIAKEKALAEQRAKEDAAKDKANSLISGLGFGNTGNISGSGDSEGNSNKGNPIGKGTGTEGGKNYSLAGRVPKSIPDPIGEYNENAKVVVLIRVNANGDVTYAKSTVGTQTANTAIIKMAEEAARKSKWDAKPGSPEQQGTIEYNFKIK